jgi:hypothetical protein
LFTVAWQQTIGQAVLSVGPARCYTRRTRCEESQFLLVERDKSVYVLRLLNCNRSELVFSIQWTEKKKSYGAEELAIGYSSV